MTTVREVLQGKGGDVWSISPQATVFAALEMMAEKNVGAVLVTEGEAIAGILSERDCVRKIELKGRRSREALVRDIMTRNVVSVRPEQNIGECMALMTANRIRHLPVVDTGKLVGLISIGDVVKAIIAEQGFTIEQLTNYITGRTQ